MVTTFLFQPTLLDCWACRDLKRFRQVLRGGGGIVVTQASERGAGGHGAGSQGKEGGNGGSLSTSQNRSPGYSLGGGAGNALSGPCPPSEVNRRDHLGRTVLHLIASSTEPASIDYLTAVLSHHSVNVNLQDHENGWTALHRALYHGNLLTALTLLRRSPPADIRVKDFEGLSPFDLYNSTVHGTNPPDIEEQAGELFTWGANRNYTLGSGTSDDRALPDRVTLRVSEEREDDETSKGYAAKWSKEPGVKYDRIQVKDIGMSKFATVILTAERSSNVWVCGIGNTGRIGRAPQTQSSLQPLRDFHESAAAIAVGPDHTCILTTAGDVYTFGFNRFQQLGYALEQGQGFVASSSKGSGGAASTTFGGPSLLNADLDIQISPRKVAGPLKKEHVLGIAAGKLHSAAFTSDALFTWGTNTGQLGYDRAATPTQIVPRKVTAITSSMSVQAVAVSDFATACLLSSGDVLLLHNDASFFVRFPQLTFSSQVSVYRPRQARPKPSIRKIAAGPNNAIAAISDIGDLWQFTPEHPAEYAQASGNSTAAKANIKPQLIWSVRKNKKVGAARDVGIGSGQDLILVTESGHVFVRSRKADTGTVQTGQAIPVASGQPSVKGKSGWKPVPFLQRVFRVATNESGGLAAIKAEAKMRDVRIRGRSLHDDLRDVLPHLKAPSTTEKEGTDIVGDLADAVVLESSAVDGIDSASLSDDMDSDVEGSSAHYIRMAQVIAEAARRWIADADQQYGPTNTEKLPLGCDMFIVAGGRHLPAHRSVVSARLPSLAQTLHEPPTKGTGDAPSNVIIRRRPNEYTTMTLASCSFGTALFILHYLYTDDIPPVWTASIGIRVEKLFTGLKMPAGQIHTQLKQLAGTLDLPALSPSLSSPVPLHPKARLSADLSAFFAHHVDVTVDQSPMHDVELRLHDRVVPCHSVLLRRSPFFAALFQPHWTSTRWDEGSLVIDMTHTRWEVARIVLMHLYTDKSDELFGDTDAERSQDQFIDFVIEVLALSNELLLDKFKLVCCNLLRRRIAPTNVAALMTDADFYHTLAFKDATMDYASRTLETLLESGMLDDLENRMIKDLTRHVREKQDDRLHRTRAAEYVSDLIVKHNDYYFDLDIPTPSLGIAAARVPKRHFRQIESRTSPAMEPVSDQRANASRTSSSPITSPDLLPTSKGTRHNASTVGNVSANDGSMMFSMDDDIDEELRGADGKRIADGRQFALPPPATFASPSSIPNTPWKSRTVEANKASTNSPLLSPSTPQDLRSIMAAEQSSRRSASVMSSTAQGARTMQNGSAGSPMMADQFAISLEASVRVSQKDRKRHQQQPRAGGISATAPQTAQRGTASSPTLTGSAVGGSPWKTVESKQTVTPFTSTPLRPPLQGSLTSPASAGASSGMRPSPGMGPTFTPTRMRPVAQRRGVSGTSGELASNGSASAWGNAAPPVSFAALGSSPSNRADGSAWGHSGSSAHGSPALGPTYGASTGAPGMRPAAPRTSAARVSVASATSGTFEGRPGPALQSPSPGPGPSSGNSPAPKSFAEIQAEELRRAEELNAHHTRAPKSFAELQEEDRQENERRVKEEQERKEFEKWFEEESRRIKKEEQQQRGGGKKAGQGQGNRQAGKQRSKGSKGNTAGASEAEAGTVPASTMSGSEPASQNKAGGRRGGGRRSRPSAGERSGPLGSEPEASARKSATAVRKSSEARRGGREGEQGGTGQPNRGKDAGPPAVQSTLGRSTDQNGAP